MLASFAFVWQLFFGGGDFCNFCPPPSPVCNINCPPPVCNLNCGR